MVEIGVGVEQRGVEELVHGGGHAPIETRVYTRRGQEEDLRQRGRSVLGAQVAESGDNAMGAVLDDAHARVADVVADDDEDDVGAAEAVGNQGDVVEGAFEDPDVLVGGEGGREALEFGAGAGVGVDVVLGGLEQEVEEGLAG